MENMLIRLFTLALISILLLAVGCKEERRKKSNRGEKTEATSPNNDLEVPLTNPEQLPKLAPPKAHSTKDNMVSLGETIEKDGMLIQPLWVERGIKKERYPDKEIDVHRLVLQFKNLTKERKRECTFGVTLLDSAGHQFNENFAYSNDGWSGHEIFPGVTGVDSEYVKTHGKAVGALTFVVDVFKCTDLEMSVRVSTSEIREVSTFELLPEFLENEKTAPTTVSPATP